MPVKCQQGDVFVVPVVDGRVAVGRVVEYVDGSVLVAIYPDLVELAPDFDVEYLADKGHFFLLETLDDAFKEGLWKIVGNWRPSPEIAVPVHKVRVWPDGGYFEEKIGGVVGRRLTDEEAVRLTPHRSYSPEIVALAVRALHGLSPWLPAFDNIRVGVAPESSER